MHFLLQSVISLCLFRGYGLFGSAVEMGSAKAFSYSERTRFVEMNCHIGDMVRREFAL